MEDLGSGVRRLSSVLVLFSCSAFTYANEDPTTKNTRERIEPLISVDREGPFGVFRAFSSLTKGLQLSLHWRNNRECWIFPVDSFVFLKEYRVHLWLMTINAIEVESIHQCTGFLAFPSQMVQIRLGLEYRSLLQIVDESRGACKALSRKEFEWFGLISRSWGINQSLKL